jgi:hypothetical protein
VHEWSAGGILFFLHYQKDGVEAWAQRAGVDIVEVAPMPFTFTLKPPAATPEPVNATAGRFSLAGSAARFEIQKQRLRSTFSYGIRILGARPYSLLRFLRRGDSLIIGGIHEESLFGVGSGSGNDVHGWRMGATKGRDWL